VSRPTEPAELNPSESGQTLLLTVGLTLVAVLLVAVVVNVSRVFLADRALAAAADSAATAGAAAVDESTVYRDGLAAALPLDPAAVTEEVAAYVELAGLSRRFDAFRVVEAGTDGTTVTVRLAARVDLPFAGLFSRGQGDGYPLDVTARTRALVSERSAP
jgi:uncharacterized membrane protein